MARSSHSLRNILGMNARNLLYVRPYNSARAVKLARNKLATKQRVIEFNLPTAKLYGAIHNRKELFEFDWQNLPTSFALKPNFGLGGNGIIIIYGKTKKGNWISNGDKIYTTADLIRHISNVLDGNFSIANVPDIAYFEERLTLCEEFKPVSYKGIPDIRVIIFNSVPVMAMLRLPTKQSDGKANMMIGGVGVGVDLATGITTYASVKHKGELTHHPDYGTALQGIKIPQWEEVLRISIAAQQAVGLGYGGIDIVIDKRYGPMILEVNGHPGLEIQNVNHLSLRDRLDRVKGLQVTTVSKGLQISKELFSAASSLERDLPVLGIFETVAVESTYVQLKNIRTLIDTSLMSTTMTREFAQRLGYGPVLSVLDHMVLPQAVLASDAKQVEASFRETIQGLHPDLVDIVAVRAGGKYTIRPKVPLVLKLGDHTITTQVAIALDNNLSYPLVVGRRDVHGFLINPYKTKPS